MKLFRITTVALAGLIAPLVFTSCKPDPGSNQGIPLITQQPEDTEVGLNQTTNLTVNVAPNGHFTFAWYRAVQLPPCTNSPCGIAVEPQTRRPGWNTSTLTITNASSNNDEGYYYCVVTRIREIFPPEVESRTRWAYLKVFDQAAIASHNIAGASNLVNTIIQVASKSWLGGTTSPTQQCNLSYNLTKSVASDNSGHPFKPGSFPATCEMSVVRTSNGIATPLTTSDFVVRPWIFPSTQLACASDTTDQNTRKFTATQAGTYAFAFYFANAPANSCTYAITVKWTW